MNSISPILLATDSNAQGMPAWVMIIYFAVIIAAFYFLLIRPQRKKAKEEKKLREIVTIGGIYGRIISLKEDTIVIESKSDHSKITIARWALQTNLTVHDDTPSK